MFTPILMVVPVQFVMGLLIGLFMDDNDNTITNEFWVSTLVFILINLSTIIAGKSDAVSISTLIALGIGWIVMWCGLGVGNILRQELIKRITRTRTNNEIKLSLTSFLRAAQSYGYMGGTERTDIMNHHLAELQEAIAEVIMICKKINPNSTIDMEKTLSTLSELAFDYAEVSEHIANVKTNSDKRNELINEWIQFGDKLIDYLWDTLRTTEFVMHNNLRKLSTFSIIRIM